MMDSLQNPTAYQPTTAETKLLEVLLNPEYRQLNKTEICQQAGVSRQTYYDAFKKPEFVAYYEAQSRDLVREAVGPVLNAFLKAAKDGSYPHGKVILEMAGMYAEAKNLNVTANVTLADIARELERRRSGVQNE